MKNLEDMYNKIPQSICKDGCSLCCHDVIQFTPEEEANMGGYAHDGHCSHLVDNKCTIHNARPLICRLFGSSEIMKCDGCKPERYLSKEETMEILQAYDLVQQLF